MRTWHVSAAGGCTFILRNRLFDNDDRRCTLAVARDATTEPEEDFEMDGFLIFWILIVGSIYLFILNVLIATA